MSDPTSILLAGRSKDSQDAMPVIEEFFRAVGGRLRAKLVNRTSSNIKVDLQEVVIQSLEAVKRSDDVALDGVFGLARFDGPQLPGAFVMQRSLLTRIIGAMLGGDKTSTDDEEQDDGNGPRPLSPVELRIALRMFGDMVRDIREVWPNHEHPIVEMDGLPGNSRIIDISVGEEEVVAATFLVGTEEDDFGKVVMSVPTQSLRSAGQKKDKPNRKPKREAREPVMERVLPVQVDVVAEMARLPMRVRDLHGLQEGDLLPLGPIDAAVVRVNGRALLQGEPGHANGQRSIRIRKKVT